MRRSSLLGLTICLTLMSLSQPVSSYELSYTYTNLNNQITSFSQYEGSFLLVEAFQTTCSFCIEQHPILKQIDDYYTTGVEILSLSIREADTIEVLQDFISTHPTTWDIGRDHSGSFANREGITNTPTLILYDIDGTELHNWIGKTSFNELTTTIDYYLTYTPGSDSSVPTFNYDDDNNGSVIGDLFGSPVFQVAFFSLIIFMLYFKATGAKPA